MTSEKTIYEFMGQLASKSAVPGGGGASALGGTCGAALGQMVANLTIGKKRYAEVEEEMQQYLFRMNILQMEFAALADADEEVFAPLAEAYRMPKETPEQLAQKEQVMEERLLAASLVPMQIMEKSMELLDILEEMAKKGSTMAISDVGVGVQFARTALLGAVMNVYINTKSMKNRECAGELIQKAERMIADGTAQADAIYAGVLKQLI